jgi:hypothetical protein
MTQVKKEYSMEFWSIVILITALPLLLWLAWAVDKKSDWDEDYPEDEVKPLLGVVAPKKEEKEEK